MDANSTYGVMRKSALGLKGISETFVVKDAEGTELLTLKYAMHMGSQEWHVIDANGTEVADMQRHAHMHPTFTIDRPGHAQVTVRKANFMQVHETWRVEGLEGGDIDVSGSVTDHEFSFADSAGNVVAETSRKWLSIHEGYAVRLSGMDPIVAVCAAVGMDVIENTH